MKINHHCEAVPDRLRALSDLRALSGHRCRNASTELYRTPEDGSLRLFATGEYAALDLQRYSVRRVWPPVCCLHPSPVSSRVLRISALRRAFVRLTTVVRAPCVRAFCVRHLAYIAEFLSSSACRILELCK